jgi:hypothetical protein
MNSTEQYLVSLLIGCTLIMLVAVVLFALWL